MFKNLKNEVTKAGKYIEDQVLSSRCLQVDISKSISPSRCLQAHGMEPVKEIIHMTTNETEYWTTFLTLHSQHRTLLRHAGFH
jgi:hypothetical protein